MDHSLPCFILLILIGCVRTCLDKHNGTGHYDYCVLGAGPAGLQMGYFLSKAKRDYIILERSSGPGSFFNKFPRHRKLISINKIHTGRQNREFNLRHDWNSLLSDEPDLLFQRVSSEFYPPADAAPIYLSMFVKELGLRVRYGVDVGRIRGVQSATGRSYVLTDQHTSDYTCSVLLVATGLWVPQTVDFVGSDLVEGYESISTNPDDYKDQAVLILGKGNSAFETAQSILGKASRVHMLSSSPVRLAWQTHYVGDLRALNNELLDTYQLKSLDGLVEARLEKIVIALRKEQDKRRSGGKKSERKRKLYLTLNKYKQHQEGKNSSDVTGEELPGYHIDNFPTRKPYDRVIRCLGFRFNFSIFDSSACPPNSENAKGRLPAVTAWYEGKNTPGLFVLGTAAHSRDYRSSAGGFIHGFRYTVRAVHRVLEHRYHNNLWPTTKLLLTQLQSWILKRVGEASGPYQMFEVLGDVILLRGSHCEYLEEFPVQALPHFSSLSGHEVSSHGLLVLVMQYGKKKLDYLGRNRAETDWTKAWKSNFLHPVLYYYNRLPTEEEMKLRPHGWPLPRPKALHHMIEDFLTEWDGPISHVQPLRRFLEHCVQTDLRTFYAESCFRSSLTHIKPPLFCQQGYLKQQGVADGSELSRHIRTTGLIPTEHRAGTSRDDPAFPNYLAQAGASMSSGLKLDF
ncbi:FAD-dependent oxidoreductase domain-containing protein 2 isoform X2 [Anabas testudineus]|uniref:FAD-dependent oxidoreductase domain containing 2 n=2 Tax=Anabas testudineus TaxID=64144 RepID=A0A3Q1I3R6_ANATE|nr:FAD-dependent oxidoreductase domain-containing protein 2 isoform X2 [Anabas testudineus]XP_026217601.1 FAD-dependent oxidoreductase domain-containing protein 2 isoform X2 [Anabas testudineus]XP_026217610.1 FAD-dependent oxidoreductase domain-containing protein 2 isoform X2 [Anabas testudineus]XP_026217619.1 FAD-dependent oxidoreductase domain-containing protein 2 isoform X2 [Anabas testudineus]